MVGRPRGRSGGQRVEKCRRGKQKAKGRLQRSSSSFERARMGTVSRTGRTSNTVRVCRTALRWCAKSSGKVEEVVAETTSQDRCVGGATREWSAKHNEINLRLRYGVR